MKKFIVSMVFLGLVGCRSQPPPPQQVAAVTPAPQVVAVAAPIVDMQDIRAQVARDEVQAVTTILRVELARLEGLGCDDQTMSAARRNVICNPHQAYVEVCTHAGMAAAAFLQAKNEPSYASWKAYERQYCEDARKTQ